MTKISSRPDLYFEDISLEHSPLSQLKSTKASGREGVSMTKNQLIKLYTLHTYSSLYANYISIRRFFLTLELRESLP